MATAGVTYFRKPVVVEAYQWDGGNQFLDKLKELHVQSYEIETPFPTLERGDLRKYEDDSEITVDFGQYHRRIGFTNQCYALRIGDWLIIEDGVPHFVDRDKFDDDYFKVVIETTRTMPSLEELL